MPLIYTHPDINGISSDAVIKTIHTANGRLKWAVGRDYAVQPGGGMPSVYWLDGPFGKEWATPDKWKTQASGISYTPQNLGGFIEGWRPLRILISDIRQERLQDISEADAVAEGCQNTCQPYYSWGDVYETGCTAREDYAELWDASNTRKGTRWQDNLLVWVLTFKVKE
jgi:hypothetical protein